MKTILITGGTGFIGSHACVALAQTGHELVILDIIRPVLVYGPGVKGNFLSMMNWLRNRMSGLANKLESAFVAGIRISSSFEMLSKFRLLSSMGDLGCGVTGFSAL